ncbi:hypothetical protein DI09_21p20 [Mitosporidium daphniae]|uniref:Uncharacterized protein n=1 Tax=Mitosporidium daphniae TaxID=1485682 RepID=A0A098VSS7_9MICR|nr:uncharacterized protein DI09_21p20 [Mitosporidium daphniae]KGG52030.1 hypothetical protein DI09_21p20 [Mitosporidium daphniae]|eukprot:XP_013238487.1 uncharacterized protein DI09_21p20 [Mitosporidium daphniae]
MKLRGLLQLLKCSSAVFAAEKNSLKALDKALMELQAATLKKRKLRCAKVTANSNEKILQFVNETAHPNPVLDPKE